MRIVVVSSYREMSEWAAQAVALEISRQPASVLGLATGETPRQMYRELVRLHRAAGLCFAAVTAFALDEYIGLSPDNPASFNYYLHDHLFGHLDPPLGNIHLIDALAADIDLECARYERQIAASGGIDLQVLGIGQNGHIGFNEPGTSFALGMHRVELTPSTVDSNARHFAEPAQVPRSAITLGISNILHAKKILLLASGKSKSEALRLALHGGVTPHVPASALQTHPDVTWVADRDAASLL